MIRCGPWWPTPSPALADPGVLDAVSPGPGETFDPAAFLRRRGTLYLLGTASGASATAGLVGALVEDVVDVARRLAARSTGARLDPPLALVLDEAANYPLPSLGALMSEGGGTGITTLAVLQSLVQARHRWGREQAQGIWDSAIVKIVLGGGSNADDLTAIARLVGDRTEREFSQTAQSGGGRSVSTSKRESGRYSIPPPSSLVDAVGQHDAMLLDELEEKIRREAPRAFPARPSHEPALHHAAVVPLLGLVLATSLSLGSGSSGGIFSPSLFMGATLGGAFGALAQTLIPSAGISIPAFAMVGMAAMVGGGTGAAMTAVTMIFEMTLDYTIVVPMIIAVAISIGCRRVLSHENIYTIKLLARRHFIPKALHANMFLVRRAGEVMDKDILVLPHNMAFDDFLRMPGHGGRMRHVVMTHEEESWAYCGSTPRCGAGLKAPLPASRWAKSQARNFTVAHGERHDVQRYRTNVAPKAIMAVVVDEVIAPEKRRRHRPDHKRARGRFGRDSIKTYAASDAIL